jgi:phosphoglycolate phosphatase
VQLHVATTTSTVSREGESEESVLRGANGLRRRETVDRLAPGCDDELYVRIVQVYRRLWFDTYARGPRLFPGTREVLEELAGRGLFLAVATAKSRRGLDQDLEATGLGGFFQTTRTVDEANSKPDPQMILDILEELGVAAEDSLVVGDTTHDLWMAHNAGAGAAAVLTGCQSRSELSQASPRAYFEDLRELPGWLTEGGS